MEDRLTELEIKIGFSEDLLEQLNRTVYRQQRQIDQLQQELRVLHQQMQAALPAESNEAKDELPPHY
jgi:SlyX protein